jgi:hypothetical protein
LLLEKPYFYQKWEVDLARIIERDCLAAFNNCKGKRSTTASYGAILAPWVRITLTNPTMPDKKGGTITVGNESFSPNHTACIREFEYGKTDGFTARFVIQDEQGGSFIDFVEALFKDYNCNVSPMFVSAEYGWIYNNCKNTDGTLVLEEGQPPEGLTEQNSTKIYMSIQSIETYFSGGKFQYEITGKDTLSISQEGSSDKAFGGEGDEGMHYLEAVRELLVNDAKRVASVNVYRMGPDSKPILLSDDEEKFHGNSEAEKKLGPKQKWWANGSDELDVVYRWTGLVESTDQKKGFKLIFNEHTRDGELQIWEDPKPACNEMVNKICIKQYVVNSGKDSPVLEFNPNFKWNFGSLASSGGGLSTQSADPSGESGKAQGREGCETLSKANTPGAGNTRGTTENQNLLDRGETMKDKARLDDHQFKILSYPGNIEADLRIIGDPSLIPMETINRIVSIIFLNPYHLLSAPNSGTDDCPVWIAVPPYNPVLSNDNWIVQGVTHEIKEGSYTTILKLVLSAPGVDVETGGNFGESQCGWKPPDACPKS